MVRPCTCPFYDAFHAATLSKHVLKCVFAVQAKHSSAVAVAHRMRDGARLGPRQSKQAAQRRLGEASAAIAAYERDCRELGDGEPPEYGGQ